MSEEEKEAVVIALLSQMVKNHDLLIKLLLLNISVTLMIFIKLLL